MATSVIRSFNEMKSLEKSVLLKGARSHSVQGLSSNVLSPAIKIPLPPRLWITGQQQYYATNRLCSKYSKIRFLVFYLSQVLT